MTFADIISLSMDPKILQQLNIPLFYEEVLEYWYQSKRQQSDFDEICEECLWFNKYIQVAGVGIMYKEMRKTNCLRTRSFERRGWTNVTH